MFNYVKIVSAVEELHCIIVECNNNYYYIMYVHVGMAVQCLE